MKNIVIESVKIVSPKKTIYAGKAKAVSAENEKGGFDILPLHSNFISIIYNKIKVYLPNNSTKEISFKKGVLKVEKNQLVAAIED